MYPRLMKFEIKKAYNFRFCNDTNESSNYTVVYAKGRNEAVY